jgi:hypothetical protein
LLAKEKLETALAEFECCADLAVEDLDCPRSIFDWNSGLALIALNRFDEGCARCLENLRKRLEEMLVGVDITEGTTRSRLLLTVVGNSSTNEKLSQFENCFHCASMLAKRQAEISCEDDTPHEGVSRCSKRSIRQVTGRRRCGNCGVCFSPSSRVLGTLLKEAQHWDPNVAVPEELNKAQSKVPAPLKCGACGIPNASNRCPCGNAHHCFKACQVKVWKEHKSDCAFQRERKGKK